ncbi:MAG: DUF1223 domain-containing protein [Usitatibacteraceae bacterium]
MRMKILAPLVAAAQLLAGEANASACMSPQRASSGPTTVALAELYTSEGCDSCPPADKWFSNLDSRKDGVVPLAFHVDYWDYIGWKDRFARAAFSERQRDTVRRQGGRTSYTPQVMLNGATMALQFTPSPSELDIALSVSMPQSADRADAAVFLAITEKNLSSRVTAGENRGATLRHDHVVRAFFGPLSGEAKDRAEGKLVINRPIALEREWKRGDLSLVAFVQNLRTGEVYQALSAPVCGDA